MKVEEINLGIPKVTCSFFFKVSEMIDVKEKLLNTKHQIVTKQ